MLVTLLKQILIMVKIKPTTLIHRNMKPNETYVAFSNKILNLDQKFEEVNSVRMTLVKNIRNSRKLNSKKLGH